QRIENLDLDDLSEPIDTMADQRTMAQVLQAPTEGYEDAIVFPAIIAENFELKHGLLTLVQNKQFFGHDKEDPHAHVQPRFGWRKNHLDRSSLGTILFQNLSISFFLRQKQQICIMKSPTSNNGLMSLSAKHGTDSRIFYEPVPIMGGNFLDRMPHKCLGIIESKSKVLYSRNKPVVAKVSTTASTSGISPDVAELKDMVRALLLDKYGQSPAPVKAVEESCVTCGGAHSYRNC
nr:reverse transcriptase domain-containing protein [Tanacetum cinerariifolium]